MSEPQEIKFTGPTMWSNYTLDKFIAPNSSRLTVCGAEEISPPNNSLGSFLLNSIFILSFPDRDKAYFINFIRRSEQAQREYINARDILTELVEKKNERPSLYFQALHHFEQSIALLYQALILMHKHLKMIDPSVEDFFKKGDGSREERLNEIYNDSKHSYDRIEKGELPPSGTLTVWLTNEGMQSNRCVLTFAELRDLLIEAEKAAIFISEELPRAFLERKKEEHQSI